ncbi:MAG: hypothetical protein AAF570_18495, partial [Bacteroidota bacterium]
QALIDRVAAENGQLLFLSGTYLIDNVSGLFLHGNITLDIAPKQPSKPILKRGPARGQYHRLISLVDFSGNLNGTSRQITPGRSTVIRNLVFDGSLMAQNGYNGQPSTSIEHQALIFAGQRDGYGTRIIDLLVEDCEFCNTGGDGIYIGNATTTTIKCCKSERCLRGAVTTDSAQTIVFLDGWESIPHWVKRPDGNLVITDFFNHENYRLAALRHQNYLRIRNASFSNVQTGASRNEKIVWENITIKIPISTKHNYLVCPTVPEGTPPPAGERLQENFQAATIGNARGQMTFKNFVAEWGGMYFQRPGDVLIEGGKSEYIHVLWFDQHYDAGPNAEITIANHELTDFYTYEKQRYALLSRNGQFRGRFRLINLSHKLPMRLEYTDVEYIRTDPDVAIANNPTAEIHATPQRPVVIRNLKPALERTHVFSKRSDWTDFN